MRALAAFLVAPLPPVVMFLVYETYPHVYVDFFTGSWGSGRLVLWCLGVAYFLILAIGVPAFFLLKRLGKLSFPQVAVAAATLSADIPVALELYRVLHVDPTTALSYYAEGCQIVLSNQRTACGYKLLFLDLVTFAVLGLIAACTFWLIYRRPAPSE